MNNFFFLVPLFSEPTQAPRNLEKVSDNGTCAMLRWKAPYLSKGDKRVFPAKVSLRPLCKTFLLSSSSVTYTFSYPLRLCSHPTGQLMRRRKPYHKDGDFGTVFVMERSCAGPFVKVDRHLSDRFLPLFIGV